MVRLAGVKDLQRTTAALDDAGQRLSRLFLTQFALNAAFGIVIGVGLFFIGVPSAPLWGILAMVLRFVPYIGAVIAAIFPLVLAAAVGPDWSMVIWTAILFAVVEPLTGHVIEPLFNRTQQRPFAGCSSCSGGILDVAVGPDRPCARNPTDCLPDGHRSARRSLEIS